MCVEVQMSSHAQDADESGVVEPAATQPLYSRPMPGGGYVRVELLVSEPTNVETEGLRGRW